MNATIASAPTLAQTTIASAPTLSVTRTLPSGKIRTFSLERALTRANSSERAQLRARLYQQQLTNGQFRPFVNDLLAVFGQKARNCAFSTGIGAKGTVTADTFREFISSFTLSGKETGEKLFLAELIRALRK